MPEKRTTAGKIIRFILTGIGLAALGAGFGYLGGLFAGRMLGDGSLSDLGLAIMGLLIGYILGIVIGLMVVKFILNQHGSVIFGIIGAIVWTGISILIAVPFNLGDNPGSAILIASFLAVPFAALGGFYLKR